MRTDCARLLAGVAWIALFGDPSRALAYEDQAGLAVGLGYAHMVSERALGPGAGLDLIGSLGLSSTWSARARASYGLHAGERGERAQHVGTLGLEVVYLIDVLQLVPFFGWGVDTSMLRPRGGPSRFRAGVHAVLGVDYLASRRLTFGLDIRGTLWVSSLDVEPGQVAAQLTGGLLFDL